jgi:hypothetical protein
VEISLQYSGGKDEPEKRVFRNFPIDPAFSSELVIAIASDNDPGGVRWDSSSHGRPQVHLAGSARALEELGRYLIALARLETKDPDPSTSLEVSNADGGTARLLPRRIN